MLNLLQQIINAGNKLNEFSLPIMLLELLGMKQYACLEGFTYINVYALRKKVFVLADKVNNHDIDDNNNDNNDNNNNNNNNNDSDNDNNNNHNKNKRNNKKNSDDTDSDNDNNKSNDSDNDNNNNKDYDSENDENERNAKKILRNDIDNDDDGNCTLIHNDDEYDSVNVYDDYLHRGKHLQKLNYMQYRIFIDKEIPPKKKDDDEDSDDDSDDDDENKDNEKPTRGRPRKKRFRFGNLMNNKIFHKQSSSHKQVLKAKHSIPVLTSKHIPTHPGEIPKNNRKKSLQWQKDADDFGSFFLCLMVPFSLYTGLPSDSANNAYDLNYSGTYLHIYIYFFFYFFKLYLLFFFFFFSFFIFLN